MLYPDRSSGHSDLGWSLIPGLETVILTSTVPTIGYLIDESDPFFLQGSFPWLIIPAVLISLRYGFYYGMASTFSIILVFGICWYLGWDLIPTFPTPLVLGLLIVTMITAEFCEVREQRERQLRTKYKYINDRMNEFTKTYHILNASHAQMEQRIAGQMKSLRASLLQMERQLLTLERCGGDPLGGVAGQVLEFLCAQTSIQMAAIYTINNKNKIVLPPLATYGNPPNIWPSNVLVQEALTTKNVVSINADHAHAVEGVLAVVPLIDSYNYIWGVIIINEMPLFDFQERTLNLLAVIGGRIGDLLRRRSEIPSSADQRQDFEDTLRRAYREVKKYHIPAIIIVATIPASDVRDELVKQTIVDSRGSDKCWIFSDDNYQKIVIKLMPLTDSNGLNGFLQRTIGCALPLVDTPTISKDGMILTGWCLNPDDSYIKLIQDIYERYNISAKSNPPTLVKIGDNVQQAVEKFHS